MSLFATFTNTFTNKLSLQLAIALNVCLLALLATPANADEFLDELRQDKTMPANCQNLRLSHFTPNIDFIVYGIEGAKQHGFSHEYPISRTEAATLWQTFKNERAHQFIDLRVANNLSEAAAIIRRWKDPMDFDFGSEGEVLELLALNDLKKTYPEDQYFHTGGIIYHEANSHRAIGELDLVIGHRGNCEVTIVGEAKLGIGGLPKAREQIARFRSFLSNRGRSSR
jgi:hypothetical protein